MTPSGNRTRAYCLKSNYASITLSRYKDFIIVVVIQKARQNDVVVVQLIACPGMRTVNDMKTITKLAPKMLCSKSAAKMLPLFKKHTKYGVVVVVQMIACPRMRTVDGVKTIPNMVLFT